MTPWTVDCQAPLSMGFPMPEYWSGLPFPSSGDLSNPGIKHTSSKLAGRFFTTEPPRKPFSNRNMWREKGEYRIHGVIPSKFSAELFLLSVSFLPQEIQEKVGRISSDWFPQLPMGSKYPEQGVLLWVFSGLWESNAVLSPSPPCKECMLPWSRRDSKSSSDWGR